MEFTTTQTKIAAIRQRPAVKKPVFVYALAIFGVFSILTTALSLVIAVPLLVSGDLPAEARRMVIDMIFQLALGVLILVSARAFARGQLTAVWLYGGCMALDSLYSLVTGYPLNLLFMGFGALTIWQILKYKDDLGLR